ncbi:hypothetical protein GCM10011297_09140 [Bacterioplanes sanyensis]|uniref:hypothetical protein n=1 Tax=Bacterioplanes sanyensis TaxID=1249553 RepID=UPI00167A8A5D|nr:hypothetical protein [Bacterioplanes sanyensis]GGY38166.1 hypothetical protein GCM10011297_09140 [Bacterioplanes sanyensis]
MSLVHKVLQDIDQRQGDAPSLPPGLQAKEPQRSIWPALAMAALLLLVVLVVAWRLLVTPTVEAERPAPTLAQPADTEATQPSLATPSESREPAHVANLSTAPSAAVNDRVEPDSLQDESLTLEDESPTLEGEPDVSAEPVISQSTVKVPAVPAAVNEHKSDELSASPSATKAVVDLAPERAIAEVKESNDFSNEPSPPAAQVEATAKAMNPAPARVTRRGDGEREQFAKALQQMQNGQWSAAQQQLQPLLESQNDTALVRYRTAYLRTLVEQQLWTEMLQFYRQHQSITAASWLAVAAPGLHMAGEHRLAAPAYRQLMRQQPQQASWPLALLWLYRQMQQPEAARQLLPQLARYPNLNAQQRRWLQQQAQELTSS